MGKTCITFILGLISSGLVGCGSPDDARVDESGTLFSTAALDNHGLLAFVNNIDDTDLSRLDIDCGLRSDSARNIIAHCDGPDGLAGTADDALFDSLSDVLDDIYDAGAWTIEQRDSTYALIDTDTYI